MFNYNMHFNESIIKQKYYLGQWNTKKEAKFKI